MEKIIRDEKHKFRKKLNNSSSKEEKKFVFDDYILYFISLVIDIKASTEKRKEIITFLNSILKLCILKMNDKFNTNIDYLDNSKYFIDMIIDKKELDEYFYEMCIFLDNNKKFLSTILYSLNEFLQIIPDFNEIFKQFYYKCNIKENSIFKIFETFFDVINDDLNFSLFFKEETKQKYIELLQKNVFEFRNVLSSLSKDNSLSLLNIEIFLFIIKKEKIEEKNELLNIIINYMKEERENNFKNLLSLITKQHEITFNDKIFMEILIKQYQKNKENLDIIDIFLSKEKYIKYSIFFLGNILKGFIDKNTLKINNANELLNISEKLENKINHILLDEKYYLFKEMILFYFVCFYENYYFEKIEEEEIEQKKRYKKILEERSLEILVNYLDYSDRNETQNIQLIYRIAFIKIYFKYFSDIMSKEENGNEDIKFDSLVKDKFLLKLRSLDIITEIRHNLKIKYKDNLEDFILNKQITYLENIDKKIKKYKIPNTPNYIPNKHLLKVIFNNNNDNKNEYPLLNQFLNNDIQIKYLKNLPIINLITNTMLNIYSYKIIPEVIQKTKFEEEINKIKERKEFPVELYNDLEEKMSKYIKSYNSLLNENSINFKLDESYKNKSIEIFLVNEHNEKNQLNNIFKNFIKYQNDFIFNISEKYFKNNYPEEIKVQEAKEDNIPKFNYSDGDFIEILMNNILIKINNNNDIKYDYEFDLEGIEKDLAEKIIPGLKKFMKDRIRTMKYSEDVTNDGIINDFIKQYKQKNLNKRQKDYIIEFIKNYDSKKSKEFLLLIQNLIVFILTHSEFKFNEETEIKTVVEKMVEKNIDKNKIELIKSFIIYNNQEEDDDDDELEEQNKIFEKNANYANNGNIEFIIGNLYPIYQEIGNNF